MTITKRGDKGSALTYNEMDENIRDLYEDTDLNRVITNGNTAGNTVITTDSISVGDTTGSNFNIITKEPVAHRNLIINGGMNIWQRASANTQITQSGGAGIEAGFAFDTQDRWAFGFNDGNQSGINAGNLFSERSTDVPAGQGFSYSTKITKTGTGESGTYNQNSFGNSEKVTQFVMRHIIEAQNCQQLMWGTSYAKPFTFSFWVKSSQAKKLVVGFQFFDAQYLYATTVEINATDTWEKKTITIPGQTDKTINNDNGQGIGVYFSIIAGTSVTHYQLNTWYDYSPILFSPVMYHATSTDVPLADSNFFQGVEGNISFTGCQLEVGDVATGFEFEPYDTIYTKCLRYNYRLNNFTGANFVYVAMGVVNSAGQSFGPVHMVHPLRTRPAVTYSSLSHFDIENRDVTPTAIGVFGGGNGLSPDLYWNHANITTGDASLLTLDGGGPGGNDQWINFDAEL